MIGNWRDLLHIPPSEPENLELTVHIRYPVLVQRHPPRYRLSFAPHHGFLEIRRDGRQQRQIALPDSKSTIPCPLSSAVIDLFGLTKYWHAVDIEYEHIILAIENRRSPSNFYNIHNSAVSGNENRLQCACQGGTKSCEAAEGDGSTDAGDEFGESGSDVGR